MCFFAEENEMSVHGLNVPRVVTGQWANVTQTAPSNLSSCSASAAAAWASSLTAAVAPHHRSAAPLSLLGNHLQQQQLDVRGNTNRLDDGLGSANDNMNRKLSTVRMLHWKTYQKTIWNWCNFVGKILYSES